LSNQERLLVGELEVLMRARLLLILLPVRSWLLRDNRASLAEVIEAALHDIRPNLERIIASYQVGGDE
jgi:hypothetical protein